MDESHLADTPLGLVLAPASLCVYCCKRPATTRDHVPPKALGGPPGDRVTVPSCGECNNGQSKDDEYLRAKLTANVAAQNPASEDAWDKTFRGMHRPEAAGFKRGFFEDLRSVDMTDASGQVHRVIGYSISAARTARVAARMVRGLYHHETGRALPDHHVLAWPFDFLQQQETGDRTLFNFALNAARQLERYPRKRVGDGVLTYAWAREKDALVWWLVFYDGVPFLGLVIPRRADVPLARVFGDFEFPRN